MVHRLHRRAVRVHRPLREVDPRRRVEIVVAVDVRDDVGLRALPVVGRHVPEHRDPGRLRLPDHLRVPGSVAVPGPLFGLKTIIPTVGAPAMMRCHSGPGTKYAGTAIVTVPGRGCAPSTEMSNPPASVRPTVPPAPPSGGWLLTARTGQDDRRDRRRKSPDDRAPAILDPHPLPPPPDSAARRRGKHRSGRRPEPGEITVRSARRCVARRSPLARRRPQPGGAPSCGRRAHRGRGSSRPTSRWEDTGVASSICSSARCAGRGPGGSSSRTSSSTSASSPGSSSISTAPTRSRGRPTRAVLVRSRGARRAVAVGQARPLRTATTSESKTAPRIGLQIGPKLPVASGCARRRLRGARAARRAAWSPADRRC